MTLSGELVVLAQRGVQLWVEDGNLRIRAAKGAMTPAERDMLAARKDEIVALLRFQISPDQPVIHADQGTVSGPVALTPAQHLYFYRSHTHRFHIPMRPVYLEVQEPVDPALLRQAVDALLVHHDALRMRFRRERGVWRQMNLDVEEHTIFSHMDLGRVPAEEWKAAVKAIEQRVTREINITTGPLIRVILMTNGSAGPGRVLLVMHHLIMDFYSNSILCRDLETAYQQLRAHKAVRLPAKTTSFKAWTERLTAYANSSELRQEREYWLSRSGDRIIAPPVDYKQYLGGFLTRGPIGRYRTVEAALTIEETRAAMHDLSSRHGIRGLTVTLAALSRAYTRWTGDPLYIEVANHGRQPLSDDVDVTRTVGWFTARYPIIIDLADNLDPVAALRKVDEQLKAIPKGGIGYGILRDVSRDPALINLRPPRIVLNYRSRATDISSGNVMFQLAAWRGEPSGKRFLASRHLTWGGAVRDGQLQLHFTYHDAVYRCTTMERLAAHTIEAFRFFIAAGAAHF